MNDIAEEMDVLDSQIMELRGKKELLNRFLSFFFSSFIFFSCINLCCLLPENRKRSSCAPRKSRRHPLSTGARSFSGAPLSRRSVELEVFSH